MRSILIGEFWRHRNHRESEWTLDDALRLGAFRFGAAADVLKEHGLSCDASLNIQRPSLVWNPDEAATFAKKVLTLDWSLAIVVGVRPMLAFGVHRFRPFVPVHRSSKELIMVPYPSGQWDDVTKAAARSLAERLKS